MKTKGGIMEGPRPLHEHELHDFLAFLSSYLRPAQAWSAANLNNVRVIKDENGFLSAAVMKPLIIKSPAGLFKVAAIGSLVTAPEQRTRGFSKQILDDCLNAGRAHGCDFAILWTNLFEFHRKFGFELAGTEISLQLPVSFKPPPAPQPLRFQMSNGVDPEAILRLYEQHTAGSVRTAEDVRNFLQIPGSRVFTAWDERNNLQAYAAEGQAADLTSCIHEWGGGVSKLLPLLGFAVKESGRPMTVMAPAHSTNLVRQLTAAGAHPHSGVLGMIKILDMPSVLAKMKKYARGVGLEDLVLEPRDGRFCLGYNDHVIQTGSESDLVRLIFGPPKASQLLPFDAETAEVFEKLFPISMWIWGWDAV
jgi:hypothetical protein